LLSGKYNNGIPKGSRLDLEGYDWLRKIYESEEGKRKLQAIRELVPIAEELGTSMAQLAIAWCLKNPNVSTVITGASRAEQVTENMKALEVVPKLTPEVMERIEGILKNKPEGEERYR
jgi:aryl-alcohol dehydrogenase-like predicted oxidoreductase